MKKQRNFNTVEVPLEAVLQKAKDDGNLVCGIFECAQMLQHVPQDVALCILSDVTSTEDPMSHIQHKLLEAFCWENDIDVIKVCSFNTFRKTLSDKTEGNIGCILIQSSDTKDLEDLSTLPD